MYKRDHNNYLKSVNDNHTSRSTSQPTPDDCAVVKMLKISSDPPAPVPPFLIPKTKIGLGAGSAFASSAATPPAHHGNSNNNVHSRNSARVGDGRTAAAAAAAGGGAATAAVGSKQSSLLAPGARGVREFFASSASG